MKNIAGLHQFTNNETQTVEVKQETNYCMKKLPGNVFVSSLSSARVLLSFDVHCRGDQRSLQACKIKVEVC